MKILKSIIGNINDTTWREKLRCTDIEYINISPEATRKNHIEALGDNGSTFVIVLDMGTEIVDGDIVEYDPEREYVAVLRVV